MKNEFKYKGKEVKIFDFAKIIKPEAFEIDDFSQVDDFVFLNSGLQTIIGKFVHIETYEQKFEGKLEAFDGDVITINIRNKKIDINFYDVKLIRLAIKF